MIREQATYFAAALSQSESTADAAVQAASAGSREPLILCLVLLILLLASLILLNFSALIWERRIYKATTDIRKLLSELPGKTERPSEDIRPGFSSEIQGSDGTDSEDSDGSGGSQNQSGPGRKNRIQAPPRCRHPGIPVKSRAKRIPAKKSKKQKDHDQTPRILCRSRPFMILRHMCSHPPSRIVSTD